MLCAVLAGQFLLMAQAPPPPPGEPALQAPYRGPGYWKPHRGRRWASVGAAEPWWEQLNLTPSQMQKINDIILEHRQEAITLRGERTRLKSQLEAELLKKDPSMSKIKSILKDISEVEYKLRLSSIEMVFEVESVLTPQQKQQLMTLFPGMGWRTRFGNLRK